MNNDPTITFHGAAHTVTGSCMELAWHGRRVLIDCGMFQGPRTIEALNREPFGFAAGELDGVILTHAHVDHSGLLPRLVAEGYKGPIWCTSGTADLLAQMLPDAGRIQEWDAERRNRRPDRRDEEPVEPLYTEADANAAAHQARRVDLERWFEPAPGFRARLWNAGHILGSASVEVEVGGARLLFSGDIGPAEKAFHPDASAPQGFDHVVCESTYGDRDRPAVTMLERRALLEQEVKAALAKGGNLVVPVFAVERTQELLLDLAALIVGGRLPGANVFIDSPLASRVTGVFAKHAADLEDMDGSISFHNHSFHFVESSLQSMRLNDMSGAIILAASGMCEAGRIRHHLLHNLLRADSTVLFVGYQAAGTLGRTILEGAKRVRLSGRDVAVKASIRRIDSYSAHADRSEIIDWVEARRPIAGSLFLTHGENGALASLETALRRPEGSVVMPEIGESYALPAGAPAKRLTTGRVDLRPSLKCDWQNDYADFAVNLKRELRRIEDAQARREAIARMREVLDSYEAHRERDRTRAAHGGGPDRPVRRAS